MQGITLRVVSFTSTGGFDFLRRSLPHVQAVTPDPWHSGGNPCSLAERHPSLAQAWPSTTPVPSGVACRVPETPRSCPIASAGTWGQLTPTVSPCGRRCLRAGSNSWHNRPIGECCTPAGPSQMAAETGVQQTSHIFI